MPLRFIDTSDLTTSRPDFDNFSDCPSGTHKTNHSNRETVNRQPVCGHADSKQEHHYGCSHHDEIVGPSAVRDHVQCVRQKIGHPQAQMGSSGRWSSWTRALEAYEAAGVGALMAPGLPDPGVRACGVRGDNQAVQLHGRDQGQIVHRLGPDSVRREAH
jgi:hypothetical protein